MKRLINKPKQKNQKNNRGSSVVEALISVSILSYVIVSILSGFSQQQMTTRVTSNRNIATALAEQQMERLLKFPTPRLTAETFSDFVVHRPNGFVEYAADPEIIGQYRRTVTIEKDAMEQLSTITVLVEYPFTNNKYPFKTKLVTKRGVK